MGCRCTRRKNEKTVEDLKKAVDSILWNRKRPAPERPSRRLVSCFYGCTKPRFCPECVDREQCAFKDFEPLVSGPLRLFAVNGFGVYKLVWAHDAREAATIFKKVRIELDYEVYEVGRAGQSEGVALERFVRCFENEEVPAWKEKKRRRVKAR